MSDIEVSPKVIEFLQSIIDELETKYLSEETRHIPNDKFFRMLYNGMTEAEAKHYAKIKMTLINHNHGL